MSEILNELKEKNPEVPFLSVFSPDFAEYGRVIDGMDTSELQAAAGKIKLPSNGSQYLPSVEAFERLPVADAVQNELFGTLPIQIGYCFGYNRKLNALEWHTSSELNVAVTPMVLLLAKRSEWKAGTLCSSAVKAFYVPQGTAIEVYATSLHFCPCQTSDDGFGCIVALPKGTNLPLETACKDRYLFRKNKWLIAHEDNTALIEKGAVPGICGINFEIRYSETV